jgi:NTP pyrophosphatase (non-canonical NTP hydrolase)
MKDLICDEFQYAVGDLLIRHHSILDVLSKLSESTCRVNRAVIKSVTDCGCESIKAEKLQLPEHVESLDELRDCLNSHLQGKLCPNCEEVVYSELGKLLFYVAALCNTLDISLYDVILKEKEKLSTLGTYSFK